MVQHLYADVGCWSEHYGKPGAHYPWNSYTIRIAQANLLALVDPLPLTEEEVRRLDEVGPPTHILLTCNYHLRESAACRRRWGCRILLHHLGLSDAEVPIDGTVRDGDRLWDTVEVLHLPHVSWPEETAFLVGHARQVLIVGDALCGGRPDIGVPPGEVGIFSTKHIRDLRQVRQTLERLLAYRFEAICFGHGSPVLPRR